MKIDKLKDGRASAQILPNQTITYDPSVDSYMIQTEVGDRIHTSTITSDIMDENQSLHRILDLFSWWIVTEIQLIPTHAIP